MSLKDTLTSKLSFSLQKTKSNVILLKATAYFNFNYIEKESIGLIIFHVCYKGNLLLRSKPWEINWDKTFSIPL